MKKTQYIYKTSYWTLAPTFMMERIQRNKNDIAMRYKLVQSNFLILSKDQNRLSSKLKVRRS